MSRFVRTASAAALILALATPAMAQVSYPRSIGSGEDSAVDYGPGGNQNAPLGGGRFDVVGRNSEGQADLRYLDPEFAQPARPGLVPVTVGSGEGSTTVWVPADTDRNRLALIGADGSLPAEGGRGSTFLAGLFARLLGRG